jgi:uncharacterized RDD family membrane protein YckC
VKARSDWTFIPRVLYADPTNRYVAGFGPPWRRAGAAVADWGVCYVVFVLVAIPLGTLQALGAVSAEDGDFGGIPGRILVAITQLLLLAPIVAYFAFLLPTSQTLGMRLSDVRIVSSKTGRGPSFAVALIRGVVSTVLAAAVYIVVQYSTSFDKPSHLDSTSTYILDASYVLAAVAFVSALIMIVTPTHRSVTDRLFGTAVLDDLEAVDPHMGPWGPVDAFDLSNERRTAG